jgi:hypothetical protein
MGHFIHSRKVGEERRFRIWSSNSDSYISNEMTEAELREQELKDAVCLAIEQYFREIDGRINRAIEYGTSSLMGDTRDVDGPWDT